MGLLQLAVVAFVCFGSGCFGFVFALLLVTASRGVPRP